MSKNYSVGYGKPPQHGKFKPGQSGNKKGRPRGTRNLRSDLQDELYARVTVTQGGKKTSISRQQALLRTLVAKALHSDSKSIGVLLTLMLKLLPPPEDQPVEVDLSNEDKKILAAFEKRLKSDLSKGDK